MVARQFVRLFYAGDVFSALKFAACQNCVLYSLLHTFTLDPLPEISKIKFFVILFLLWLFGPRNFSSSSLAARQYNLDRNIVEFFSPTIFLFSLLFLLQNHLWPSSNLIFLMILYCHTESNLVHFRRKELDHFSQDSIIPRLVSHLIFARKNFSINLMKIACIVKFFFSFFDSITLDRFSES